MNSIVAITRELKRIERELSVLRTWEGGGSGGRTFVVAAADSQSLEKEFAHFQCDGEEDEVEIMLAAASGNVMLLDGTFTLSAPIAVENAGVLIAGAGTDKTTLTVPSGGTAFALGYTDAVVLSSMRITAAVTVTGTTGIETAGQKVFLQNLWLDNLADGVVSGIEDDEENPPSGSELYVFRCVFNSENGIALLSGKDVRITECKVFSSMIGIEIAEEATVMVAGNFFSGCSTAIESLVSD